MSGLKKKKGRYLTKKQPSILWLVLLLVILSLVVVFLITQQKEEPQQILGADVSKSELQEKDASSIAIPGYEAITLKANTKKQTTALQNPAQNVCLFRVSLILEDGTVLWVSDYIEPGDISDTIVLSKELEPGTYPNSILKYECFTMDGNLSALNGAETKLTLIVKQQER